MGSICLKPKKRKTHPVSKLEPAKKNPQTLPDIQDHKTPNSISEYHNSHQNPNEFLPPINLPKKFSKKQRRRKGSQSERDNPNKLNRTKVILKNHLTLKEHGGEQEEESEEQENEQGYEKSHFVPPPNTNQIFIQANYNYVNVQHAAPKKLILTTTSTQTVEKDFVKFIEKKFKVDLENRTFTPDISKLEAQSEEIDARNDPVNSEDKEDGVKSEQQISEYTEFETIEESPRNNYTVLEVNGLEKLPESNFMGGKDGKTPVKVFLKKKQFFEKKDENGNFIRCKTFGEKLGDQQHFSQRSGIKAGKIESSKKHKSRNSIQQFPNNNSLSIEYPTPRKLKVSFKDVQEPPGVKKLKSINKKMRFVDFEEIQKNGSMKLSDHLYSEQRGEQRTFTPDIGLDQQTIVSEEENRTMKDKFEKLDLELDNSFLKEYKQLSDNAYSYDVTVSNKTSSYNTELN